MHNMFFSLLHRHSSIPPRSPFGPSLLMNGVLLILFGLLFLAEPDLIAYIVAVLLIIVGCMFVASWWRMKR